MKKVTRKDIAKAAGVSPTTVTYVLRNTPGTNISIKTKKKVKAIAKKMRYHPDFAATSLITRRTNIIGLLLPSQEKQFASFYSHIIAGLIESTRDTSYHFLYLGQDQPQKYKQCIAQGYLDAIIIIQSDDDDKHVRAIKNMGKPAITLNFINKSELPYVTMDYERAVENAYKFMISHRRKKVAFLCMDDELQSTKRLISAHKKLQLLYKNQIEFSQIYFQSLIPNMDFMEKLLKINPWDGFVVDGPQWGVDLAKYLQSRDWVVGKHFDLSFLNYAESNVACPKGILILAAQPEEVGRNGWIIMNKLLTGKSIPETQKPIPFIKYLQ